MINVQLLASGVCSEDFCFCIVNYCEKFIRSMYIMLLKDFLLHVIVNVKNKLIHVAD